MTWVVPLALGAIAIATMAVFTALSARRRHQGSIAPAATVGPRILVHDINDDRCTGCDACVAVCPTNVLDLVSNKSRVLRFQDCIQCEACMYACPTEALVMFPEGTPPPPLKVPEIDDTFQTAVPGQYLIGEVAGKPLVKNAANLGRAVVEHMLATGLRGGALGRSENVVDVVIVGSGPGGLSAALSCVQRGLSYVVLEKEQMIASTINRYPKGKLVMAEPYDSQNVSLLPVFDSSKEALIPIWKELLDRIGVPIRQGESVEQVVRTADGAFETRTTVATYRSQRVVLSIGTRGKPRTLQVPGENLPKVRSMLEDPDEFAQRQVLVVGGGDSAVEAALALADAGARVIVSYRGKGFQRAAPKNKQAIEAYAAEGRVKAKLGSQVISFDETSVTLALADGTQKQYPNEAAFVLIGADPPVAWLEKMGVRFVERPHQYQMGKSDEIVRRFVPAAVECPEDAPRAAAQVLGGAIGPPPPKVGTPGVGIELTPPIDMLDAPVRGPRKWLRSATSLFSTKGGTNSGLLPRPRKPTKPPPPPGLPGTARGKKLEQPMPLSELVARQKYGTQPGTSRRAATQGDGRRDSLSPGERTRILRMLRDEGGRMADEDSHVYIGSAPPGPHDMFDLDDSPAPAPVAARPSQPPPPRPQRPDVPAKPAVVVGLAQAQANANARRGRPTKPPPRTQPPPMAPPVSVPAAPPVERAVERSRVARPTASRRPVPPPFSSEPTRQVDDSILAALRAHDAATAAAEEAGSMTSSPPPRAAKERSAPFSRAPADRFDTFDPPTIDESAHRRRIALEAPSAVLPHSRPMSEAHDEFEDSSGFNAQTRFDPSISPRELDRLARQREAEAAGGEGAEPGADEATHAVDIRGDRSISDVDWDLE